MLSDPPSYPSPYRPTLSGPAPMHPALFRSGVAGPPVPYAALSLPDLVACLLHLTCSAQELRTEGLRLMSAVCSSGPVGPAVTGPVARAISAVRDELVVELRSLGAELQVRLPELARRAADVDRGPRS
jgi:hypothetical protein